MTDVANTPQTQAVGKCRNPDCPHVFEAVAADRCPHCLMSVQKRDPLPVVRAVAPVPSSQSSPTLILRCNNRDCASVFEHTSSRHCSTCGKATVPATAANAVRPRATSVSAASRPAAPAAYPPGMLWDPNAQQWVYVRTPQRRRSLAWIYYTIIAVISLFFIPTLGPKALLGTVICGAYATYIFCCRPRFVLWFF